MSRGSSGSKSASRTIRNKIMLFMTTILFLFTFVSGYCLYLVMMSTQQNDATDVSSQETFIVADKIPGLVTNVQQQANQFISRQDMQSVPQYQTALNKLTEQVEKLESTDDRKNAQVAAEIRRIAGELDTSFLQLVNAWQEKGLSEKTGLKEKLQKAVIDMESAVPLSDSIKLKDGLVQVKRAEIEYFGSLNVDSLDLLEITSNTLEEIISRAMVDDQVKQSLQKNIKAYIIALNRYQAVSFVSDDATLKTAFAGEQQRQKEAMRGAAQDLKDVISRVNDSPLDLKAKHIRQYTKEYLLQGDDKNVSLLNKTLEEYVQELNVSTMPQDQRADILKALASYNEALGQLTEQDKIIQDSTTQALHALSQLDSQAKLLIRKPAPEPDRTAELITFISREDILPAAGSVLALVLIGLIAAMSLAKSVSSPIVQMTDIAEQISAGHDPDLKFPSNRKDELGLLAHALNDLLQREDTSPIYTSKPVSHEEGENEYGSALASSPAQSTILDKIGSAAHQIINLSDVLPQTVEKITEQNRSIQDLLEQGNQTHAPTWSSDDVSLESSNQLTEIAHDAEEVGEEMSVLALNAAIKAARAGTQGKEFIIVAEELDSLAKRSAESARNFTLVVENITSSPADTTVSDDDSGQPFTEIVAMNSSNSQALDEIAIDTNIIIDQAREIEELVNELNVLTGLKAETGEKTSAENETNDDDEYPNLNDETDALASHDVEDDKEHG